MFTDVGVNNLDNIILAFMLLLCYSIVIKLPLGLPDTISCIKSDCCFLQGISIYGKVQGPLPLIFQHCLSAGDWGLDPSRLQISVYGEMLLLLFAFIPQCYQASCVNNKSDFQRRVTLQKKVNYTLACRRCSKEINRRLHLLRQLLGLVVKLRLAALKVLCSKPRWGAQEFSKVTFISRNSAACRSYAT